MEITDRVVIHKNIVKALIVSVNEDRVLSFPS